MSPCYYLCCKHYQPLYPQVRLLYERVPLHRKPFVQVIVMIITTSMNHCSAVCGNILFSQCPIKLKLNFVADHVNFTMILMKILKNVDKTFPYSQHLDDPVIEYYPMIRWLKKLIKNIIFIVCIFPPQGSSNLYAGRAATRWILCSWSIFNEGSPPVKNIPIRQVHCVRRGDDQGGGDYAGGEKNH